MQLKKLNLDIICLQETHIKKSDKKWLEYKKLGNLFCASDLVKKKKKGLTIYAKEEIEAELIYASDLGRILMVEIVRKGKKMLLVYLYTLND